MGKTTISWATDTWNPIIGCSKCSPGCAHCYAEVMAGRQAAMGNAHYAQVVEGRGPKARWNGKTALVKSALDAPLHWKKPRTIFVCSMSDLFHPSVPDEWIDRVYAVMALCPQHLFKVLTKRADRMAEYCDDEHTFDRIRLASHFPVDRNAAGYRAISAPIPEWPLNNLALGATVCNQPELDDKLHYLLRTPAAYRFISFEPGLGALDISSYIECHDAHCWQCGWKPGEGMAEYKVIHGEEATCIRCGAALAQLNAHNVPGIHQVICGGESGQGARPLHPDWVRSLRDDCKEAGVPFHFKQWGEWAPFTDNGPLPSNCRYVGLDGEVRGGDFMSVEDACMGRVGKHQAGRLLDGVEHLGEIDWERGNAEGLLV